MVIGLVKNGHASLVCEMSIVKIHISLLNKVFS